MIRKSILAFVILILTIPAVLSQQEYKTVRDPLSGSPMLYGKIDTAALDQPPFSEWFKPGLKAYNPDTETVIRLINNMAPEYDYIIVMGTWCPDSHREVPRMIRVLDAAGVPASKITIYAVDRKLKARHTPVKNLDIHNVPTLIVSKDGKEAGRIIESPKTSVENDLLRILSGE